MNVRIDFEKSVQRKRLIYQGTRKQRFFLLMRNLMSGMIALTICLLFFLFITYDGASTATTVLASLPALVVIMSMFLQNRLAKVKGTESREDKIAIIRFLLSRYPGIIRHNCSEQIIIISTPPTSLYNKEFLILQDGHHIYMNISLYGQGRLKYLFLTIPQYFTCKAFLKDFHQTILRPAKRTQMRQERRLA